VQLKLSNAEHG